MKGFVLEISLVLKGIPFKILFIVQYRNFRNNPALFCLFACDKAVLVMDSDLTLHQAALINVILQCDRIDCLYCL